MGRPATAKSGEGPVPSNRRQDHTVLGIAATVAAATAIILSICTTILLYLLDFWGLSQNATLCSNPVCREFAKLINDSVEQSTDPCANFDAFVCSGWRTTRKYSVNAHLVINAADTMSKLVGKDTGSGTPRQTYAEKAGRFYRSCDAIWRGERDDLPVIRELLMSTGIVWPRRSANPSVARTLLSLSIELNWAVVVNIVASNRTMRFRVPISYVVAEEESSRQQDTNARKRSFDVIKAHFSVGDEGGTATFDETAELEETFFEPLVEARKFTGEQLLHTTDEGRWNECLAQLNRTPVSTFKTNSADYVRTFFQLWKQAGESRTHLFISWMAVRFVSTFANSELVSNYYGTSNYETIKYGQVRKCYLLIYRYVGDLLFAQYNAAVFGADVRADVERILHVIRNTFAARLAARTTTGNQSSVGSLWSSLRTVLRMLNQAAPDNATGPIDAVLPEMSESLARNMHAAWKHWSSRGELSVPRTLSTIASKGFPLYVYQSDDFILLPYAISFPLYDLHLVDAAKFGAFGGVVARASAQMARSFYEGLSPAKFNETLKCTDNFGEAGAPATREDVAALKVLVDAYEAHGSRRVIAGLSGFTPEQLLFVSWCFSRCRGFAEPLSNECNAALRHVPAFSSAFGCTPGDPLNPVRKCAVS